MTLPHRVSVIIPARNADKYIAETFDSLLAQTDPSWQAIVINDKSTDSTQAIIDAYAARDPRFVSFEGPGVGVSSARNLGLDKAEGERIMFLDSDDWIDANWLELMNGALDSDPDAVVAYCGYKRVMVDGHTHDMEIHHDLQTDPFGVMARVCAVGIHTVLIDRRELDIVGRFDTAMRNCEDWDLWLRIARRPGKWIEVPQYLSYYRCGHTSLSQNVDSVMEQSEVVLSRGFSADPRVPDPAPQNRHGTAPRYTHEFDGRIAGLSAWCMGSSAGTGRDVAATRKLLRPIENSERSISWLPHTILEGFVQGSGIAGDALADRWDVVEPRLETVLTVLSEQWRDDEAIGKLREGLQMSALSRGELIEPKRVGNYLMVNVDLNAPQTVRTFDGLDRLFAQLKDGDEKIGEVTIGILDEIPAEDWMLIALSAVDHKELEDRFGERYEAAAKRLRHEAPVVEEADDKVEFHAATNEHDAWEEYFSLKEDPFGYNTPYEVEKFERAINILPNAGDKTVVEVACAEGHFSKLLAPHVGKLMSSDISETAVKRAAMRCAELSNVEFKALDLVNDPLPSEVDAIYCAEVLYYLPEEAIVRGVAQKMYDALKPGGYLILVHAFVVSEDRTRTGFDWGNVRGPESFRQSFLSVPGLVLERTDETELYRIDRFVRLAPGQSAPKPIVNRLPLRASPWPDAARTLLWGGAKVLRSEVDEEQRTFVPVLMYHAIADEGPPALDRYRLTPKQFEEQMQWLRQNGYHSISSVDLAYHLAHNKKFSGRPVIITFDDGMQNFADNAWPILQKYDFTPEMFIVTDRLGGTSDWDAEYGSNYPLMDEATILRLANEGVIFGSHMATHPKSDKLSTRALLDELERSRDKMTALLGKPPIALAAPYGLLDVRYAEMARRAGYTICYSTEYRAAYLGELPLQVPRLEVFGNWQQKDFIQAMKPMLLPDFQMVESDDLISVVVPARENAGTIEATVNSILAQSHRNLEIIIVDDGSGDGTLEKAEALAALDDRIRVISQGRAGVAAARNAGWQAAGGRAVAFVDADDTVAPNMIRTLYSALLGAGDSFGLAYSWSNQIDRNGEIINSNSANYNYGEVLRELVEENFVANGSAALVWRRVLKDIGGFDSGLRAKGAEGAEDLLFYLRVAEKYKFAQVPDYLTNDRRLPRSRTGFASRSMRSWYLATDQVLARHPEYAEGAKAGARRLAKRLAAQALYARRPLELPKLMREVAPRDPGLALKLPLSIGMLIARKLKQRVQRLGVVGTLRSTWSQVVKRV
jgi:glycosyltransferase involved in cell wall biosynthesis/peptidoglycan/xylan/chitin deacetylase (PgdA/CDA1 family)/cyclopropane fatty-acyl-phospholipid synthase-like methyltransferase